jgi:two-component system alkaline phosphatase synthesis response regulator PhoP
VLAVDDEPDILKLIEVKLEKAGIEVLTARDGEEGLNRAMADHPDVVMMPRMDGFTSAGLIKQRVQPVPVIVMLTAKG